MTVRVAQKVGFNKISKTTKNFGVYEDVPELLSVSLGSAETTLIKLTNAYSTFVNGGKKVYPIFIDKIQDRRGKTIFSSDKRKCKGCEKPKEFIKRDLIISIFKVIANHEKMNGNGFKTSSYFKAIKHLENIDDDSEITNSKLVDISPVKFFGGDSNVICCILLGKTIFSFF